MTKEQKVQRLLERIADFGLIVGAIIILAVVAASLQGCATTNNAPEATAGVATVPRSIDFTSTKLATVTHADLQAAAARADKNGFPARAAVWRSFDVQLTAWEQQANVCEAAIKAALPLGGQQFAGAFDAIEAAAESVGTGIPASVRVNCAPLPIPQMPTLPGIPKL